jgi:hypothetical protein
LARGAEQKEISMGTFHQNKGELHGITVVVETSGEETFVGRCDEVTDSGVILLDADVHTEGEGKPSRAQYLATAAQVGVWKKFDRIVVPLERVAKIHRLGELES